MKLRINEELSALIPALQPEEYELLEKSLLSEGCRDSLIIWNDTIIDGHNRYKICTKHNIEFDTQEMKFNELDDVKEWMINNQFSRRNLPLYQRAVLALKLKPIIEERAKDNQIRKPAGFVSQNSVEQKPIDTQKELAKTAGVSHDTIHKVEKIEEKATPEVKAKIASGEISINKAYQEIAKPHVAQNSGNNEWYTPIKLLDIARKVMGSIDTDPASSEIANRNVRAETYYTEQSNGLDQEWNGNVWMNPPYAQPLIQQFANKLIKEIENGNTKQAMVLVNNATETKWFNTLSEKAAAIWFIKGRVKFIDSLGNSTGAPLQGQAVLYFGENTEVFFEHCEGLVCRCEYK